MTNIIVSPAKPENASKIGEIAFQSAMLHYESVPDEFQKPTLAGQIEYIQKSVSDKKNSGLTG
ncbi:MAG: hypothetical protein IKS41_02355 [Alphaproteobacteria bacterium]|nr:hypothetical protein [Alphaproteobacteria bacterium]